MVLNVVRFPRKTSRFRKKAMDASQERGLSDFPDLVSRFRGLESKAKRELHDAILLLDLAALHAQRLVRALGDSALKKTFEDDLKLIDELLRLAREKTLQLH